MNNFRYILEPYKGMNTRYRCPSCNKNKSFSRYIDTETGQHITENVGRCNRESNCGYHYTPKQYFTDNNISFHKPKPESYKMLQDVTRLKQNVPISFIPDEVFKASLKNHEANHLVKFLINLFGVEVANKQISRYFIANSMHWRGATIFWQIDINGKVRTGKIMLYNPITGKRVKEPFNHVSWAHAALNQVGFELRQCFFGEHLLRDKTKLVAIVESEKTAVIAGIYLPQFIWLAVGSLTNLNAEKCFVLKGRNVLLFPDLNGFEKWSSKSKELSHITSFTISDLLERKATESERKQGLDLADYLIRFNYKEFAFPKNLIRPEIEKLTKANIEQPPAVRQLMEMKAAESITPGYYFDKHETPKPGAWEQDIIELEKYFESVAIPTWSIKLNQCSMITNVSLFVHSHLSTAKIYNGKRTFLPYLNRLQDLKQYLILNIN